MSLNALAPVSEINTYIEKANEQIAHQGGKQVLNPDVFYSKQLMDTIRLDAKEYMYYRYADEVPMNEKANKLQVRRWAPLQAHTAPLLEGQPPKSDKGSVEYYEIDTNQYGRYMEFSDKVDFKVVDPVIAHYAREYSIVAIETLDLLAREALFAINNLAYAGQAAGFEGLTLTSKPTLTDLRKVGLSLKKQLVKPRSNGKFHVIAGPEFFFDMVNDVTVEKYMTVNQTTKTMYDNTKLVPLFDLEFYETLACPSSGEFTTVNGDNAAIKALRLVGYNENGTVYYLTITEDTLLSANREVDNGPFKAGTKNVYATMDGYVSDSRTGQDASYIPGQEVWDIAAVSADATLNPNERTLSEFKVQHVLVLGKDALIRTGIAGRGNAQMYTKAKGSAGVLDPIDQRQSIGFKIDDIGFGSARLEAVVDYMCVPSMLNIQ